MSKILPLQSQEMLRVWQKQAKIDTQAWDEFIAPKEEQYEKDHRAQLKGLLCYVDHETQTLILEDAATHERQTSYALNKNKAEVQNRSEPWGKHLVWSNYQDGRFLQQRALAHESGLWLNEGQSYLFPSQISDPHLGISSHYYSPFHGGRDHDAYDLYVSQDHQFLFVTHRWAGKISVFSLPEGTFLGPIKVRGKGSYKSMGLSCDTLKGKLYISDCETDQLHIFDLYTWELSSHPLLQGRLGNLALDPHSPHIYIEVLRDTPELIYMSLEDLSLVTQLSLKGQSLCLAARRPIDLLQLTPDQELLLLMTYQDTPEPFTPIVNVIQMRKTRTVRRYAIKTHCQALALATAQPNPFFKDLGSLLDQFLERHPLREDTHVQHQGQSIEHKAESGDSPGTAPLISLPDSAENAIVSMCQEEIEKQLGIDLREHPLQKRKLRRKAMQARQQLENGLSAEVALEMFNQKQIKIPLNRQNLFETMAKDPEHEGPLFMPNHICPYCAYNDANSPCPQCQTEKPEPLPEAHRLTLLKQRAKKPLRPLSELQLNHVALLKRVSFLKNASEQLLQSLAQALMIQEVHSGEVVIHEGTVGACLYFILEGQFKVYKEGTQYQFIANLIEGDVVGEMAIVTADPRSASVKAMEKSTLLRLDRSAFLKLVLDHPNLSIELKALTHERQKQSQKFKSGLKRSQLRQVRSRMVVKKLRQLDMLKNADEDLLEALAKKMKPVAYLPNVNICVQDDPGDRLFFITRGKAKVIRHDQILGELPEGSLFGEMSFFYGEPRSATVASSSYCRLMELSFSDFETLAAEHESLLENIQDLARRRNQENKTEDEKEAFILGYLNTTVTQKSPSISLPHSEGSTQLFFTHLTQNTPFRLLGDSLKPEPSQTQLLEPARIQNAPNHPPLIVDSGNDRILVWEENEARALTDDTLKLNQPNSAYYTSGGEVLIADTGRQRLVKINAQGEAVWELSEGLIAPICVAETPEGTLLYADQAMHQVVEMDYQGNTLWKYGTGFLPGSDPGEVDSPCFAQRQPDGRTLIADTGNHRLLWVGADGSLLNIWKGKDTEPLFHPFHCEWGADDCLYVMSQTGALHCFNSQGEHLWQTTFETSLTTSPQQTP